MRIIALVLIALAQMPKASASIPDESTLIKTIIFDPSKEDLTSQTDFMVYQTPGVSNGSMVNLANKQDLSMTTDWLSSSPSSCY